MYCTSHETTNNAVLVTVLRKNSTVIVAICVAGMLMDKIKRRKLIRGSKSDDLKKLDNGPQPGKALPRRSSRMASLTSKFTGNGEREVTKSETSGQRDLQETPLPNGLSSTMHNVASQDGVAILKQRLDSAETQCLPSYSSRRSDLLRDERRSAWDFNAKSSASELERAAGRIVLKLREHERIDEKVYGNVPGEAVPPPNTRDMGGRFLVNRPRIAETDVFKIARQLPKGAHLHLHFNSELPATTLLPQARKLNNMFIRSTRPLREQSDFDLAEIVMNVLPETTSSGDIYDSSYKAEFRSHDNTAWMRWKDFRDRFPASVQFEELPEDMGDLDRAERWVQTKMIVTPDGAYNDRQTTNGAWACFNQGTRAFKGLLNYASVYEWYIKELIQRMIDDNVMYVELRPMLLDKTIPADNGIDQLDHKAQMDIIVRVVNEQRERLKSEGRLDQFPFGMKIIYCTPRSIPREKMKAELEDCLRLKLSHPDLVCGFDLVGAEDRPNHIGFYGDLLDAFTKSCKEQKVEIPFMFHAGETLIDTGGSHNPDNSNLYDSLLLNAKRIGHGYSLLKHPLLVQKYIKQNICLELCPVSNELLHLCGNVRQHIFPELLAAGLHCTLNADNPSLFSSSLSHEFYQVMVGDPRMTLHGWKQLAEWSIIHSCLSKSEVKRALEIHRKKFEAFCGWIVGTYQQKADGLKDLGIE